MVSRAAWGEFGFSWLRKTTVKTHKMRAYAVGVVLCRVLAFLWLTRDAREPRRARLQDLGYPPPMVLSIEVTAWEACVAVRGSALRSSQEIGPQSRAPLRARLDFANAIGLSSSAKIFIVCVGNEITAISGTAYE